MSAKHKEDIKLAALMKEVEEIAKPGEMEELVRILSVRGVTMLDGNAGNNSDSTLICVKWDKLNSFFFAFTAVTTIGTHITNSFIFFPSSGFGTDLVSSFSLLQAMATRHRAL